MVGGAGRVTGDVHVYATARTRYALLVMDRPEGYGWLRAHGFPAFWCRKRQGFLLRPTALPDLRAMCQYEGIATTEHNASGPRQAAIRRHHATHRHTTRRTA